MHMHVRVLIGIMLAAVYVLLIAVALFVSRLRTAVMLAVASSCGLYATVWSALRPLLASLASVAPQSETLQGSACWRAHCRRRSWPRWVMGCAACSGGSLHAVSYCAARLPTWIVQELPSYRRVDAPVGSKACDEAMARSVAGLTARSPSG